MSSTGSNRDARARQQAATAFLGLGLVAGAVGAAAGWSLLSVLIPIGCVALAVDFYLGRVRR